MTDVEIAQAHRDWAVLRSDIQLLVRSGTPSRRLILCDGDGKTEGYYDTDGAPLYMTRYQWSELRVELE